MKMATHKKQIKWPVLIVENTKTGHFTAILKGVEGVVAQGNTEKEVMKELVISLEAMLQYLSEQNAQDEKEPGMLKTMEQKELLVELC